MSSFLLATILAALFLLHERDQRRIQQVASAERQVQLIVDSQEVLRMSGRFTTLLAAIRRLDNVEAVLLFGQGCQPMGSWPLNAMTKLECGRDANDDGSWFRVAVEDEVTGLREAHLHLDSPPIDLEPFVRRVLIVWMVSWCVSTGLAYAILKRYFQRPLTRIVTEMSAIDLDGPATASSPLMDEVPSELAPLARALTTARVRLALSKRSLEDRVQEETHRLLARRAAHDVRSPLSALLALSARLKKAGVPDAEVLELASHRIEAIARDLLRTSSPKSRTSKSLDGLNVTDLASSCEELVREFRLLIDGKTRVRISCFNGVVDKSLRVIVEPEGLKRVLGNLLQNAIDATGDQNRISVHLERLGKRIELSVRDTGKGIPESDLLKLGQLGWSAGKKDGNGLGLYSAREECRRWGAELAISSQLGQGTTVVISFPLVAQEPALPTSVVRSL